jgi:DNA polymerase-3 subunit delta
MGQTVHVFDFLNQRPAPAPVEVLFGDEPFFKRLVLKQIRQQVWPEDDALAAQFDGPSVEWRDVRDELCSVSLFNPSGLRLAVVRDADDFVQDHRSRLEEYVEHPEKRGVLVLDVTKWASNTRLYKLVDKHGLQVECRAPLVERGKQKVVDQPRIITWLIEWAKTRHDAQLAKNAAAVLLEMIGAEFGLLDQELAKLVLYAGPSGKISEELVREVGGGWRAKTAWEVIDAALSGNAAEALRQLDRLLQSGEVPQALFGPISWSLRRFASATRIFQRAERRGQPMRLPEALEQAGFFKWQRDAMQAAERQLKQLGRERAAQLPRWLLDTDMALKGSHSSPDMARLALEHLLLRMDQGLAPRRAGR